MRGRHPHATRCPSAPHRTRCASSSSAPSLGLGRGWEGGDDDSSARRARGVARPRPPGSSGAGQASWHNTGQHLRGRGGCRSSGDRGDAGGRGGGGVYTSCACQQLWSGGCLGPPGAMTSRGSPMRHSPERTKGPAWAWPRPQPRGIDCAGRDERHWQSGLSAAPSSRNTVG
eukprot:scaffold785_cov286-Prasinococcus_capsulatus_cf.AAC.2